MFPYFFWFLVRFSSLWGFHFEMSFWYCFFLLICNYFPCMKNVPWTLEALKPYVSRSFSRYGATFFFSNSTYWTSDFKPEDLMEPEICKHMPDGPNQRSCLERMTLFFQLSSHRAFLKKDPPVHGVVVSFEANDILKHKEVVR